MKRLLIAIALSLLALAPANAQQVAGNWQGTLKVGPQELRIAIHIAKASDGSLSGTMDSLDQAASGIPIGSIAVQGSNVAFSVPAIAGSYTGTLNSAGNTVTGTWSQGGQSFPLDFKRITEQPKNAADPTPSDIDGVWGGSMDAGGTKLRLVFHIHNTENGLTATMDSPDQGAKGIPVTLVDRQGAKLRIEMKQIAGAFDGTISGGPKTIDGTWTQGGRNFPLILKRVEDAATLEPRRPQDPKKPYPYREEEVAYENKAGSVKLAGTITTPTEKGPFPAVLLITGSGPQDRDETIFGHHPFLVLSDYLTRKGVVVLRVDDRGVGKSGGDRTNATSADYATDAEAGLDYLKTRPKVDQHKIGLIGHSEGAMIAAMIAARNPEVAFIVMMAGSAVPGEDILIEQVRKINLAAGRTPEQAAKSAETERQILDLVKAEKDPAALQQAVREKFGTGIPDPELKAMTSPWYRFFLEYDPATALRQVKCPVLAINGAKDVQVPPEQNLPAIRKALEAGGNKRFETVELPGLNHLFQTAQSGSPTEYGNIEETIAPAVLEKIANWIREQ